MRRIFSAHFGFLPRLASTTGAASAVITCAVVILLALPVSTVMAQNAPELRSDHPDKYVVQKGDTLWDIASKFLKDPWRWPLIWQNNPEVQNPHLIFPGDLLVVTGLDNIKIVRLKPQVRRSPLDRGIPAIPPHIIAPFLTQPSILEEGELDEAGYVLQGVADELVLGKYNEFYGRKLGRLDAESYRIFHVGEALSHPDTDELLGIEAKHLGEAIMLRGEEDISKLRVIESNQDIGPGDRLVPIDGNEPLPYFEPRGPVQDVNGWILLAPKGVREIGRFDVVIISGGEREGLEPGHVLRTMAHRENRKDPVTGETYDLPDESSGLMMVFRVFDKLSYALIMRATEAISVGDKYINP